MRKLVLLLAAVLIAVSPGCQTTQPDGVKVYDEQRTEALKAALHPLVSSLVRRGIVANPESREYVSLMADALEQMRDSKSFDPGVLNASFDRVLGNMPKDKEWSQYLLDAKNTIYALYVIFWKDKSSVVMGEEKWGYHLTDFFSKTIRAALNDSAE